MPRFAANLAYLFTERPLIERFGAAAAAGFKAVELQFPYDHAPSAVKAELERHGLTQLGVNTALGGRDGDCGPRRGAGPRARLGGAVQAGARLHGRDRRQRDPLHGRQGAAEQRPAAEKTFIANLARAADLAQEKNITLLIEPINSARPAELFPHPRRAGRRRHRQGRQAEREDPVRFLSCADHGRRSDPALREAPAADRPCADRRGALARRARRGRDQLSGRVRGARPARLVGLDRLRIPAARRAPRTGSAGAANTASAGRPRLACAPVTDQSAA